MRRKNYQVLLALFLGIALCGSLAFNVQQWRRLAEHEAERGKNLRSLQALRDALRQEKVTQRRASVLNSAPVEELRAAVAQRDAKITELTQQFSDALASAKNLQTQLQNSNTKSQQELASAKELLQKTQQDSQNQINTLKQQLASALEDAEISRQRAAALETNNAKLRSETSAGSSLAAEVKREVAQLQGLDHRRDAYLTSVMRRYRDITSQFQAMGGVLDASRDSNANAFSNEALARIQDALSLANDDLRQLNDLNDQIRQLAKKLATH
jgi:DNA repair exonuclease SbcCD ATPase subunit